MKYQNIIPYFCSFFLFIIIIFGSFSFIINNKSFFYNEYKKNKTYQNIAVSKNMSIEESKTYTEEITINIFNFLKDKEELKYFNDNEKSHMEDVKKIISNITFFYYLSTVLFIILLFIIYILSKKDKILFIENISKILLFSSSAALLFLLIFFLWSVFSFETLFLLMHTLLFPQGNWMFPNDSLLIILFPENFFFSIGLRIFIYAIFQSIIFFILGYWLRKQIKLSKSIKL